MTDIEEYGSLYTSVEKITCVYIDLAYLSLKS